MTFRWFKKDASSAELRELLATTEAALTAAHDAVTAAQDSLDADGSDSAVRGLLTAQESETIAQARVDAARRNLDAAVAREAAERRAQLEARAAELVQLVRHDGVSARLSPLLDREMECLDALVGARLARLALHAELSALLQEHRRVCHELGVEDHVDHRVDNCTNPIAMEQRIRARIAELDFEDPRKGLLNALIPDGRTYRGRL